MNFGNVLKNIGMATFVKGAADMTGIENMTFADQNGYISSNDGKTSVFGGEDINYSYNHSGTSFSNSGYSSNSTSIWSGGGGGFYNGTSMLDGIMGSSGNNPVDGSMSGFMGWLNSWI